jgi:hypothetical protein
MYEQRQFVIFDVSELPTIDFEQVLETSAETVRLSTSGTKTFVKWDGDTAPSCVETLTTKSMYYTYEEMLDILNGEEWTGPDTSV